MWADQRLPRADRDISADDLSREYDQFRRNVHWRRLREVTGAAGGLIAGVGLFFQTTDLAPQIGGALSMALAVFIAVYLAIRTSVEPMPQQATFAFSLTLYRRELERQTTLVKRVAWLWSLTIIPPLIADAIGRALGNAQPFVHPVHVGGYLLICFFVGWLYVQHARTLEARNAMLAGIAEPG
jgi:hypothetical protein